MSGAQLKIYNLLQRIFRRRLRQALRGYRRLRDRAEIDVISNLKRDLTVAPLCSAEGEFSKLVFGAAQNSSEAAVRQYLLYRLGGRAFGKVLLMSVETGRPIIYPMPAFWQRIVRAHGFQVAGFCCTFLWNVYCLFLVGLAVYRFVKVIGESSREGGAAAQPRAHFIELSPSGLPSDKKMLRNSILGWYLSWSGRPERVKILTHCVKARAPICLDQGAVVTPCPALPGLDWCAKCKLLGWTIAAIGVSLFGLLRGNPWNALLLNQAVEREKARLLPIDALAEVYLFHNSNWIYRPLWTYEAEARKSQIVFYFYSTNCEAFKRLEGYPPVPYGWAGMTWPHYLVWDAFQKEFVLRALEGRPASSIESVGPLPFDGHSPLLLQEPAPRIRVAVFDVQPMRDSVYQLMGIPFEYYIPHIAISFLSDIAKVGGNLDVDLLWKKKRNVGRNAHPLYRSFLRLDPLASCFIPVEPDVAAADLVNMCDAVISMPFTSTALIASVAGKPSVYYDPNGDVMPDDRAAHGVPVLRGRGQLESWLRGIRKSAPSNVGPMPAAPGNLGRDLRANH